MVSGGGGGGDGPVGRRGVCSSSSRHFASFLPAISRSFLRHFLPFSSRHFVLPAREETIKAKEDGGLNVVMLIIESCRAALTSG